MARIDLTIPFSLSQITLGQYQDYLKVLEKWDKEDKVYLQMKILQIFCKMSPEDVQKISLKDYQDTIEHINELFEYDTATLIRRFKMTGSDGEDGERTVEFGFIPKLDDISFGEYIDLETYIGKWDDMHKAMAVLFRPVAESTKGYYLIEDYEGSSKYAEAMRDMPVDVALSATVFFLSFRDKVTELYSGLFGEKDTQGGADTSIQANFGRKWGWYQSIHTLAQGDVRRIDEVTKTSLHKCLMMLEFEKDKNKVENHLIRKSMKK